MRTSGIVVSQGGRVGLIVGIQTTKGKNEGGNGTNLTHAAFGGSNSGLAVSRHRDARKTVSSGTTGGVHRTERHHKVTRSLTQIGGSIQREAKRTVGSKRPVTDLSIGTGRCGQESCSVVRIGLVAVATL